MNNMRGYLAAAAVLCLLCGTKVLAQPAQMSQKRADDVITQTIKVKYMDFDVMAEAITIQAEAFNLKISADKQNRALIVTGSRGKIRLMEGLIRQLDNSQRPTKNIEITAYLLTASESANLPQNLPAELEPVLNSTSLR